jgi:hypothetical protein
MVRKLMLLCVILALMAIPAFQAQAGGPTEFPNTNPLTGLPVSDPAHLALPPALVSIANFPISARPQAGLSSAPIIFEMYIGEGMTRFLAVFYGDYPTTAATANGNQAYDQQVAQAAVGPIRSGRLAYEKIRKLYNGFLVMASGYKGVLDNLRQYTNFYGLDQNDVNSALIPVDKLEQIAQANQGKLDTASLSGMLFDAQAPSGGQVGQVIRLPYSFYNQVIWRYDDAAGAYQRYQDNADAQTFVQATDRLNGAPLAFENVIVLFAEHEKISDTIYDMNLRYIDQAPALLFRDGQVYKIFWTTANGDYEKETGKLRPIRFIDAQGNSFPLKPGHTWVEMVTPATYTYETVDTQAYADLKQRVPGSGVWAVRFMAP